MSKFLKERILVAVKATGSISLAAVKLGISQPAVSIGLKKIEEEVGGHVYFHGERPITLTGLGEIL